MRKIRAFFAFVKDRPIRGRMGMLIIQRSMAICMAALYHEYLVILMQVPEYSAVQAFQKKETGVHWKIMTKVFDIPKPIDRAIRV